jgi:hypothetical protein
MPHARHTPSRLRLCGAAVPSGPHQDAPPVGIRWLPGPPLALHRGCGSLEGTFRGPPSPVPARFLPSYLHSTGIGPTPLQSTLSYSRWSYFGSSPPGAEGLAPRLFVFFPASLQNNATPEEHAAVSQTSIHSPAATAAFSTGHEFALPLPWCFGSARAGSNQSPGPRDGRRPIQPRSSRSPARVRSEGGCRIHGRVRGIPGALQIAWVGPSRTRRTWQWRAEEAVVADNRWSHCCRSYSRRRVGGRPGEPSGEFVVGGLIRITSRREFRGLWELWQLGELRELGELGKL